MRAFLSTSDSHLRLPYPSDWLARYYGEQAVIEARRILAETEPERDAEGWLTAHVPASFPEHGHTELAEALAAFVGERD